MITVRKKITEITAKAKEMDFTHDNDRNDKS